MAKKKLKDQLIVGTKIKLGRNYVKNSSFKVGEILELVEGEFEIYNGLYNETETAPSVWNEASKEFDSIYHLFGNDLEDFGDCKVIYTPTTVKP